VLLSEVVFAKARAKVFVDKKRSGVAGVLLSPGEAIVALR
jgi:hypothetical protein